MSQLINCCCNLISKNDILKLTITLLNRKHLDPFADRRTRRGPVAALRLGRYKLITGIPGKIQNVVECFE